MNDIKIYINIPGGWIDTDDPLLGLGCLIQQRLDGVIEEAVREQLLDKIELPKVEISREDVKDRMLDILAKKALESGTGYK